MAEQSSDHNQTHELHPVTKLHTLRPSPVLTCCADTQYLVFEYVEKTLLEVLEGRRGGLEPEEVSDAYCDSSCRRDTGKPDSSILVAEAVAKESMWC